MSLASNMSGRLQMIQDSLYRALLKAHKMLNRLISLTFINPYGGAEIVNIGKRKYGKCKYKTVCYERM